VRRAGRRVRVNAQLIDAETDLNVWAERFDHDSEDLFELQDAVTSQIAVALNLELVGAEAARPSEHPDGLDYILRGRTAIFDPKGLTRERLASAMVYFENALSLDPGSLDAKAFLALALAVRALEQLSDTVADDIERAEQLVAQVLAVSPHHALAHFAKGQILRSQRRFEAAIPEYEIAIAANRNEVAAIAALGICKFFAGRIEEAIPAQELAIRLSPRDPRLPNWYWRIGMIHLLQSRIEEAIVWLRRAHSANPQLPGPHAWLASAYALTGDTDRAAAELAAARRLSSDGRYSSIARFKRNRPPGSARTHALYETTFYAGLRKAGMPEDG
jgi:adenylate cyclase